MGLHVWGEGQEVEEDGRVTEVMLHVQVLFLYMEEKIPYYSNGHGTLLGRKCSSVYSNGASIPSLLRE